MMCPLTVLLVARNHLWKISWKLFFLLVLVQESTVDTRGNLKKRISHPKRFAFCMKALQNWKYPKTMQWHQHYGNIYFHFTMSCVKPEQGNDCGGCYNSQRHLHSTHAQSFTLPSPKGILWDISCQTEVIRGPFVCIHNNKMEGAPCPINFIISILT